MKRNKQSRSSSAFRKPARKRPEFKEGTLKAMRLWKAMRGGYQCGWPAWFEDIWDWEQPAANSGQNLHFLVFCVVGGVRDLERVKLNPDYYFFANGPEEAEALSKCLQERHRAGELPNGYSLLGISFNEFRQRGAQNEEALASLCVAAAKADDPAFFRHVADCLERGRSRTLKHGERLPKGAPFKASVLKAYGDFLKEHPRQKPMSNDIADRILDGKSTDKKWRAINRQIEAAALKMNLPLLKKRQPR